ncbi:MAG: cell division protein FtsZ [Candidatus Promineifilaceae bacterium]
MRRENTVLYNKQTRIVGIGNGGTNAVNCMISAGLQGVQFITINTDSNSLAKSNAPLRIQIGKDVTQGTGTGGKPAVARKAANEARQVIQEVLLGADVLFITAGLGGGTGSGAAPVVASIAKELGIPSIAVVTRPFRFEGSKQTRIAKEAIKELEEYVDYLIVFPNGRLSGVSSEQTTLKESFCIVDNLICQGVQVINEFIRLPGLINVDLANLKAIMANQCATLITVGRAEGVDRARVAAEQALVCPLLGLSIHNARGILINITASTSLDLEETQTITNILKGATHPTTEYALGIAIDETMGDAIRITVIASGFRNEIWDVWANHGKRRPKKQAVLTIPTEAGSNGSRLGSGKKGVFGFSLRNIPIPGFLSR